MNYVIKIETTIKNVKSKNSNFSKSWFELNQVREWPETESSQRMTRNCFWSLSKLAKLSGVLSSWTAMLEKKNRYHQTDQNCRLRYWKKQTQTASFETRLFWIQKTKNKKKTKDHCKETCQEKKKSQSMRRDKETLISLFFDTIQYLFSYILYEQ